MNFVSTTFKYYFKNFFRLLLIFLPATVFFVFLVNPSEKIRFLFTLENANIENFVDILNVFFPHGYFSILYLILFAVIFALTISIFTATSEYHMRTGKHNFKESIRLIPSYILPCLVICLILLLASVILNICFSAICYFSYKLIVVNKVIKINILLITSIFFVLINLVYAIIGCYLLYTANHIMLNKSTMGESLGLTALNFDKKFFTYLCSFILPCLIMLPCYILLPNVWWAYLIYGVCFVLSFMYLAVLNLTSFYSINNLERNDLSKYPYIYFK